jgi:phosphate transport system permease protein
LLKLGRSLAFPLGFVQQFICQSLAIARAAGEATPLLFTALFSFYFPSGVMELTSSLSVLIYNFATSPYADQQAPAWAASLILMGMVLITSIIARYFSRASR